MWHWVCRLCSCTSISWIIIALIKTSAVQKILNLLIKLHTQSLMVFITLDKNFKSFLGVEVLVLYLVKDKLYTRVVKNIENIPLDLASKFEGYSRITLKNP